MPDMNLVEVARELGLTSQAISQAAKQGRLKVTRYGPRKVLVSEADNQEFFDKAREYARARGKLPAQTATK